MSLLLKLSLHFKIQYFRCAQMIILSISDFGVSTAILNPMDVFRRWCKLSFRPMGGQVKSRHFSEQTGTRRSYFHFLYKYIGIISYKQLGQLFWKLIQSYCYLLDRLGLDLEFHNFNLVQKIPTNNSNVWFFKHHKLSDLEKLNLILFQIAEQVIQESFHTFPMASLFG